MISRKTMLHVKETLADLTKTGKDVAKMKFKKVQAILEDGYRVMPGVIPERYTAMVLSVARGHTTDEDVLWHM